MQAWQLNPQARLRHTAEGGAVFLPDTGTTVELNAEAFAAVSLLGIPQSARDLRGRLRADFQRNFTLAEIDILLCELAERNIVVEAAAGNNLLANSPGGGTVPTGSWNSGSIVGGGVPVPESVHLQLNHTCNLRCPSCYVALHPDDAGSLPLERIEALIEEWAAMGVFQLALGGGEVLMSEKFVPVVRAARDHGLAPNVTTNGWLITEALLDQVHDVLGEMRMSLNDAVTVSISMLEAKAVLLRRRGVRFGFNLMVTRCNLSRLGDLLSWGCAQGAATINLIRPKPAPGNERWYEENALSKVEAARLVEILKRLEPLFTRTALSVDCAFSFLFYGQSPGELQARGVAGCAMGERFATVKWNGDVYPCSHLHGDEFKAGNVLTGSFREVWERSEVFALLRQDQRGVGGSCGDCAHSRFCGGCRAVMNQEKGEWLAGDAGCPR